MIQSNNSSFTWFKLFERIFSIFALFHFSQALTPLILTGGASEGEGGGLATTTVDLSLNAKISLLVYFITFVLLALRWKRVLLTLLENKSLWILIGIASFSYFWSVAPADTLRYSIYTIGTTAFGLYLATRYSLREQLDILSYTYGVMLILSVLLAVALPHYGIMGGVHEGALRGVFTHKNQFGAMMVPGGVVFLLKALRNQRTSWIYWLLLIGNIALIVLSRSTTALATMAIMLLLCLVYRIFRWRYELMISAILGATVFAIGATILFTGAFDLDSILAIFGKDATFSSRTLIWQYVWDKITYRPWFGYGLAAFWQGLEGPSGYIQLAMRVTVVYAHNGFLDLWLSIGLVGLSVFLVSFFGTAARGITWLRNSKTPEGLWPILFLTYILLSNISEGTITTMDNSFWAIFTAISYSLIIAKSHNYLAAE